VGKYIKIGNKLVQVDHLDTAGKPVIKATAEEIKHPDGHVDVIVHVPCLQIASANKT
jgi:hypothetical protein